MKPFFTPLLFLFFPLLLYGQRDLDAVESLSRYLQHPSVSGSEEAAGSFFAGLCAEKGLHVTFLGQENGYFNFTASLYPLSCGKPNIIFLNHIDVVTADTVHQAWTHPPFSGAVEDGKIWGRGAFDNKGAAIMQLFALAPFVERAGGEDLPFNISLLAVSCEETQCEGGVRSVIRDHLDRLNPVVVFGEGAPGLDGIIPSKPDQLIFGISIAHKRAYWLELRSKIDCSAHGSVTPQQYSGKEMVVALHRLLNWKHRIRFNRYNIQILKGLGRIEGGVAGFFLRHPRILKPVVGPALRKEPALAALFTDNITLTGIRAGGHAVNVIPQNCTAMLDCRLLPETDEDRFLKKLKRKMRSSDIGIALLLETPQVIPSPPEGQFYQSFKESLETFYPEAAVLPIILPNFTDDGWFHEAGIPCYSSVPAFMTHEDMECVHGGDENLPVQALMDGIAVYTDLIGKLLSPSFGVKE